jgi:hypothetical protein
MTRVAMCAKLPYEEPLVKSSSRSSERIRRNELLTISLSARPTSNRPAIFSNRRLPERRLPRAVIRLLRTKLEPSEPTNAPGSAPCCHLNRRPRE